MTNKFRIIEGRRDHLIRAAIKTLMTSPKLPSEEYKEILEMLERQGKISIVSDQENTKIDELVTPPVIDIQTK